MADRLGELLMAQGLLTDDQVRQALAEQQKTRTIARPEVVTV
jgi:hypothetical protein